MTKREYFDLLVETSKAGKFPAINAEEGGLCVLRTADGRKCAVGLLIPDEVYTKDMETSSQLVRNDSVDVDDEDFASAPFDLDSYDNGFRAVVTANIPDGMTGFDLAEVQAVHDNMAAHVIAPPEWEHDVFVRNLLDLPFFSKFGDR